MLGCCLPLGRPRWRRPRWWFRSLSSWWRLERWSPIPLATVIAIMVTVTACLLVAGVVGLAGTASYAGALLRHSLDGAVIAGALCFLGWAATAQLFRDPAKLTMPDQVMLDCTPAA